jgi:hypothetical protein
MAVRIKIKLKPRKGKGNELEVNALINSGFETEEPEIVLPIKLAQRLGLWPELRGGTIETYEVAGGERFDFYFIKDCVEVRVVTKNRISDPILSNAAIAKEKEILISDKLASAQKIVIEDVGEGLWRFRDEDELRKSEIPEYW